MHSLGPIGPVGAIYRGAIRRAAFSLDLETIEQKSFVDSMFRFKGTERNIMLMKQYLDSLRERIDALDAEDAAREATRKANKRWWKPHTWFD
jgi:hypothetical protein